MCAVKLTIKDNNNHHAMALWRKKESTPY